MKIKELNEEERPREKFKRLGADALSSAELLTIILRTGCRTENVVSMCQRILASFPLSSFSETSIKELCSIKGVGEAKALQIKAIFELAKIKEESAKLKEKKEEIEKDLIAFSKQHKINVVYGEKMKASVKEIEKLSWEKEKLEKYLKKNDLYEEYASLNYLKLGSEVKKGNKKFDKFAKKEKDYSIRLSKGI